jgi:TolA-binding protein
MSARLKIAAYVVLAGLTLWFGIEFYKDYSLLPAPGGTDGATNSAALKPGGTNQAAAGVTRTSPAAQGTNSLAATNTSATNGAAAADVPASAPAPAPGTTAAQRGNLVGDLAAFVLSVIGLGLLIAYDVTQMVGSQAVEFLFNDKSELMRDPEYERAEDTWANGKHLEAVEMMREYLKKHPREQYVALRIAEIYEKDLRNYVAASLEYEEIIKKKLPDERWGWAAIHLCNIYTKMNQQEKVNALLQRIARDYPKTSAAKKARRNLGLPEPEEAAAAPAEELVEAAAAQNSEQGPVFDLDEAIASTEEEAALPPAAASAEPPPEAPSKPSLPPGFRPKK